LMREEGVIDHRLIGDHQKTFTAIYTDPKFSEEAFVQSVIRKTDASPFYVYPSGEKLWGELQKLVYHQDEPFNSTSIYAQWNVMRLARQNGVTVLLDGQGGDELLGGYDWHHSVYHAQLLRSGRLIEYTREMFNRTRMSGQGIFQLLALSGGKSLKQYLPKSILQQTQQSLGLFHPDVVGGGMERPIALAKSDTNLQKRLWQEETQYNLQQLLRYEDRNSMAFAIEARTPFIDYRLVEHVMQIPPVYKIHQGWSKYILRKGMANILPNDIQWRKDKVGFITPEREWFDQHKENIRELLTSSTLRSKDFIDATRLKEHIDEFLSTMPTNILWRAINLELWMRVFRV
jgi:asparagine synthase (glutamine-hydrolysing)